MTKSLYYYIHDKPNLKDVNFDNFNQVNFFPNQYLDCYINNEIMSINKLLVEINNISYDDSDCDLLKIYCVDLHVNSKWIK